MWSAIAALLFGATFWGHAQQNVDLIIEADYLLTMASEDEVFEKVAVVVDGTKIVAIDAQSSVHENFEANVVLPGTNRIVLPGLINAHTHAAMTLFRGMADDLELMEWLNNYIFPLEREFVDEEFVRLGTELACLEMLKGGTTTAVDMYFFADVAARVFETCGMRALVSTAEVPEGRLDAGKSMSEIESVEQLREMWGLVSDRVHPIVSAHAIYTIPTDELNTRRKISNRLGLAINIHVAESPFEVETSKRDFGTTPVSYLDSIGFFEGGVLAAHMVYPTDEEIELLATKGIGVVHNPTSNMKLASGVSPVAKMLAAGVNVGIGTDGAASNNDLDLWTEIHLATLLQKVSTLDPKVLPAFQALEMATIGGARAMGLADVIGTLEVGKQADVIQVDISDVQHTPIYDVPSHLVYVTDATNVVSVVVDGEVVVLDRVVTTLDEDRVKAEAAKYAIELEGKLADRQSE